MSVLRQRFRILRAHPWSLATAFAAVVSASALGGALLSVVNGLLFAAPGVPRADALVRVITRTDQSGWRRPLTFDDFKAIRQLTGDQSVTSVLRTRRYVAASDDDSRTLVQTGFVSGEFFEVVGGRAAKGRLLAASDEVQTFGVAVLSHDLWARRFKSASTIVGDSIEVDGRPYQVVGVLDEVFTGPFKNSPVALWLNVGSYSDDAALRDSSAPEVFGLAPTLPARERLSRLARLALEEPRGGENRPGAVSIVAFEESAPDLRKRTALPALFLLISALVGIGAFNLASCMILITSARHREVAIRLALGASPSSIASRMLVDACTISFAGFVLAALLVPVLAKHLAALVEIPFGLRTGPDLRTYAVMALASLATAFVATVAPLRHLRSRNVKDHLHNDEGRAGRMPSRDPFHRAVIGGQVCLSVLLVVVSSVWLRAAHDVGSRVDEAGVGFDASHVLYARSMGMADGWTPEIAAHYWATSQQQLERLQFVVRTALAEYVFGASRESITLASPSAGLKGVAVNRTSAEYFETMGIQIVAGRAFTRAEVDASAQVAVVSEHVARSLWGSPAAGVGASVTINAVRRQVLVVGVIADALAHDIVELSEPVGLIVMPLPADRLARAAVLVRVRGEALRTMAELQSAMPRSRAGVQPRFTPLGETVRDQVRLAKIPSRLSSLAAVFTLIFTVIGLEELAALTVRQRLWEIAVRLALGAPRRAVAGWVVRVLAGPVGIGATVGLLLALALVQALSGVLLGTRSLSLLSLAASAGLLVMALAIGLARPLLAVGRLSPADVLRL